MFRTTIAFALLLAATLTRAIAAPPPPPTSGAAPVPPRLAFTDGEVSFWRTGAEDWAPAQTNTPLAAGDALYVASGGNLELELGARAFVRAGGETELDLESLENGLTQFRVTGGHVALDASQLPPGQAIEIDTPSAAFTIEKPGYYRVDVDDKGTTFITRRGGEATVEPAGGEATTIGPDRRMELEGTETATVSTSAAPEPDEWDRWNLGRTTGRAETPRSAEYVPPTVAGTDELDHYGDWRDEPEYGHVWVPHEVPAGWAPYSTGRWIWDPFYGWTWVDDAPWGWAPYHYGRWVALGGVWGWAPGPVVVAPVYAPALVAFFGPTVSVSIGTPFVGWVALGWGEPCVPWWGRPGFVGHAWWGGWGGPRVVNNVVIQRNTFVNVKNVTVYKNVNVQNAVVGVRRDHFGQGRVEHVRLDAQKLHPVHGHLGVRPTAASLVPREGRAARPPDAMRARRVVATRPPEDVGRRLHAAGLNPGRQPTPAPRIVAASRPASPRRGSQPMPGASRTAPGHAPPRHMHADRSGRDGSLPAGAGTEQPHHGPSAQQPRRHPAPSGTHTPRPSGSPTRSVGRNPAIDAPPSPPRMHRAPAGGERRPAPRESRDGVPRRETRTPASSYGTRSGMPARPRPAGPMSPGASMQGHAPGGPRPSGSPRPGHHGRQERQQ